MQVSHSYNHFFILRRDLEIKDSISPVVYYESGGENIAIISMVDNVGTIHITKTTTQQEYDSFISTKSANCHKVLFPTPAQIKSHNFCDTSTWNDPLKSIYCFQPDTGYQARLIKISGICDYGIDIGQSKRLFLSSWFSYDGTTPCPTYTPGTPTSFGTPLFDPGNNVFSGWYLQPGDANQDYVTWLYLNVGQPTYAVRVYTWKSLNDLKTRASDFKYIKTDDFSANKEVDFSYDFFRNNDYYCLRSSLNERLEAWVETDTPFSNTHNVGAVFTTYFSLYKEW